LAACFVVNRSDRPDEDLGRHDILDLSDFFEVENESVLDAADLLIEVFELTQ